MGYVYMPVPEDRFDDVLALLAPRQDEDDEPTGPFVEVDGLKWTAERVAVVRREFDKPGGKLRHRAIHELIDIAVERSPDWFRYSEVYDVCTAEGLERDQVRTQLGVLSRFTKSTFGTQGGVWPLDSMIDEEGDNWYAMPALIHEWWEQAGAQATNAT